MAALLADGRHPNEADFLAYVQKCSNQLTRQTALGLIKRNADWIAERYPASAHALLPKLRELYKAKAGK